jgi:hypothetical protein
MPTKSCYSYLCLYAYLIKQVENLNDYSLYLFYIGKYLIRNKSDFPERYDETDKAALKKEFYDVHFRESIEDMQQGLKCYGDYIAYFPDDPLKDNAIYFLFDWIIGKEIPEIDIGDPVTFYYIAQNHAYLSIIYNNIELFRKKLSFFIYGPHSKEKNFLYLLETLREEIIDERGFMIGYWYSKIGKIISCRIGTQAKTNKMLERINIVKNIIVKKGTFTEQGIELSRNEFIGAFEEAFKIKYVSPPTISKYKNMIQEALSKEKGKKIEIIIKK